MEVFVTAFLQKSLLAGLNCIKCLVRVRGDVKPRNSPPILNGVEIAVLFWGLYPVFALQILHATMVLPSFGERGHLR